MDAQPEPQAEAALMPSAPRVGPVRANLARPRIASWFAASFLHVAVAVLLAFRF